MTLKGRVFRLVMELSNKQISYEANAPSALGTACVLAAGWLVANTCSAAFSVSSEVPENTDVPDRAGYQLEVNTSDDVCDMPQKRFECSEPLAEPEIAIIDFTGDANFVEEITLFTSGNVAAASGNLLDPNHTVIPASKEALEEYQDNVVDDCVNVVNKDDKLSPSLIAYNTMPNVMDGFDYMVAFSPDPLCDGSAAGWAYTDYGVADVFHVKDDDNSSEHFADITAHEELHLVGVGHSGTLDGAFVSQGIVNDGHVIRTDDLISSASGYLEYGGNSVMGNLERMSMEPELLDCMSHFIDAHNGQSPLEKPIGTEPLQLTDEDVDMGRFVSIDLSEPIEKSIIEDSKVTDAKISFDKFLIVPRFAGINFGFRLALFDSESCTTVLVGEVDYEDAEKLTLDIDGRIIQVESGILSEPITITQVGQ